MTTSYERIGGASAVRLVVDKFYDRVLADTQLVPYFKGFDTNLLRKHLAMVVTEVLGGPKSEIQFDLQAKHAPLHITKEDYHRLCAHFQLVLVELNVPADIYNDVGDVLKSLEPVITSNDNAP